MENMRDQSLRIDMEVNRSKNEVEKPVVSILWRNKWRIMSNGYFILIKYTRCFEISDKPTRFTRSACSLRLISYPCQKVFLYVGCHIPSQRLFVWFWRVESQYLPMLKFETISSENGFELLQVKCRFVAQIEGVLHSRHSWRFTKCSRNLDLEQVTLVMEKPKNPVKGKSQGFRSFRRVICVWICISQKTLVESEKV